MSFKIASGSGGPSWDPIESGRFPVLQFSTDGLNFQALAGPFTSSQWTAHQITLPAAASSRTTRFRWIPEKVVTLFITLARSSSWPSPASFAESNPTNSWRNFATYAGSGLRNGAPFPMASRLTTSFRESSKGLTRFSSASASSLI